MVWGDNQNDPHPRRREHGPGALLACLGKHQRSHVQGCPDFWKTMPCSLMQSPGVQPTRGALPSPANRGMSPPPARLPPERGQPAAEGFASSIGRLGRRLGSALSAGLGAPPTPSGSGKLGEEESPSGIWVRPALLEFAGNRKGAMRAGSPSLGRPG